MKRVVKIVFLGLIVSTGCLQSCSFESCEDRGCMHSELHSDQDSADFDVVSEQYEDQKHRELDKK